MVTIQRATASDIAERIDGPVGQAPQDIWLWPNEPIPNSYFALVQQLVNVVPRIDAVKRSTCIEGAQVVLARDKMYWAKMKATDIAA